MQTVARPALIRRECMRDEVDLAEECLIFVQRCISGKTLLEPANLTVPNNAESDETCGSRGNRVDTRLRPAPGRS
ncbi:hypothetical protein BH24GEM2_BH24GEM2_01710 [soil metagenome]